MSYLIPKKLGIGLSAAMLCASTWLYAGAGHDHGHDHEDEPRTALPSTPRLAMESAHFELLVVQEPHGLQLYLDDFATNAPRIDATIDLEINGQSVEVENTQQGTYHVHLAAPLDAGEHTLMATIIDGNNSDLLVGEWDIHPQDTEAPEVATTETNTLSKLTPLWLGIGSGMGIILISAFWRDSKNKGEDHAA